MFDYDGPIVRPSLHSFNIMRETADFLFGEERTSKLNWRSIFSQTKGTTDSYFLEVLCNQLNIIPVEQNEFKDRFYRLRAKLIMANLHEREVRKFDDELVYQDFLEFLNSISNVEEGKSYLKVIVTGNPREVMKVRLPEIIGQRIDFMVCGDEGRKREELIGRALKEAEVKHGFKPWRDKSGRLRNAFYFDDTARAIVGGLSLGVKSIYVMHEGALEYENVAPTSGDIDATVKDTVNLSLKSVNTKPLEPNEAIFAIVADPNDPRHVLLRGLHEFLDFRSAYELVMKLDEVKLNGELLPISGFNDSRLESFLNPETHRGYEGHRRRKGAERDGYY
ncbi:hypothetical protein A2W14_07035 [Candidatus Gottesmanbacteria bacterium RBG_16_37_8]|uniref:Haloacid dehalogenase n=1 Tax=Candidatus Gottesmanbacteria bacterium RBG_16_37_8 TaxID=1798371 RepID=A0A1F5YSV5_9BACT|nr:MAG: hypothetical protein A2W14_07035 [Candidatus Gottesmanbacteria bacterium RBG_16_37_8]